MISGVDFRLAELIAARLCHELAGAITAVANGADILGESGFELEPGLLALIGDSARRAASRLQFYRFAYGFGGASDTAGPPPGELAAAYLGTSRITCRYDDKVASLPLMQQKLGCNLLAFGAEALPRGGHIAIDAADGGLRLDASGEGACLADEQSAALGLRLRVAELTTRTVQGYFTGLLAQTQGWRLVETAAPSRLSINAIPALR
jgi:histidine phosphotransferase ChpT